MKCFICGGRVKKMDKNNTEYHCRGECGLILRLQNSIYEKDLEKYLNNIKKGM